MTSNNCQNHIFFACKDINKINALYNAVKQEKLLEYLIPYPSDMNHYSNEAHMFRMENWGIDSDISTPNISEEIEEYNGYYSFGLYTYTSDPLLIAIDSYADNNQDVIIDYNYVNHVTMVWGTYNSHEGHYQYDDLNNTTIISIFEDC